MTDQCRPLGLQLPCDFDKCNIRKCCNDANARVLALTGTQQLRRFEVETARNTQFVQVHGQTIGDLRVAIEETFGFPPFEQQILFEPLGNGEKVAVTSDENKLLKDAGLDDAPTLFLSRCDDPRQVTDKIAAFVDAVATHRFDKAKEALTSSGTEVDPNSILMLRPNAGHPDEPWGEAPCESEYPALTVIMMAGLPRSGDWSECRADEFQIAELAKRLLNMKADVNKPGEELLRNASGAHGVGGATTTVQGKTPLCVAVQRGSPMLVRLLLDARANPNQDTVIHPGDRYEKHLKPADYLRHIDCGVLKDYKFDFTLEYNSNSWQEDLAKRLELSGKKEAYYRIMDQAGVEVKQFSKTGLYDRNMFPLTFKDLAQEEIISLLARPVSEGNPSWFDSIVRLCNCNPCEAVSYDKL